MATLEPVILLQYEDVFDEIIYNNLSLPPSVLNDIKFVEELISYHVAKLHLSDALVLTSYLNMISQTHTHEKIVELSQIEIKSFKKKNFKQHNRALFYRNNLMVIYSFLFKKNDYGHHRITFGNPNKDAIKDYYKALLLINNLINYKHINAKSFYFYTLLREYPCYHTKTAAIVYTLWLKRYIHIYCALLPKLKSQKNVLSETIKLFEKKYNIDILDFYRAIFKVHAWFLIAPLYSQSTKKSQTFGFSALNLNTFLIKDEKFSTSHPITTYFKAIASDENTLKNETNKINSQKKFSLIYSQIPNMFNHPLLKLDEKTYCILDFKSLMAASTHSLFWKLREISNTTTKFIDIKAEYGRLVENEFTETMESIFNPSSYLDEPGMGDYYLLSPVYDLVFEFMTSYYVTDTFYTENFDSIEPELEKLLFSTKKTEAGKFVKLDNYINHCKAEKRVPILVTEKQIGDYELLNRLDYYLDKKISQSNLENIKKYKPLIICLDDIEYFKLHCSRDKQTALNQFIECIDGWQSCNKEEFLFIFAFYIEYYFESKGLIKKNFLHNLSDEITLLLR